MGEHTPGPWIAGAWSSIVGYPVVATPSGRLICNMSRAPGGNAYGKKFNAESEANARLIAAAPDLLAVVQHCYERMGCTMPGARAAKAAIAKATTPE